MYWWDILRNPCTAYRGFQNLIFVCLAKKHLLIFFSSLIPLLTLPLTASPYTTPQHFSFSFCFLFLSPSCLRGAAGKSTPMRAHSPASLYDTHPSSPSPSIHIRRESWGWHWHYQERSFYQVSKYYKDRRHRQQPQEIVSLHILEGNSERQICCLLSWLS